jgi:Flp pilus assembly protein TadG
MNFVKRLGNDEHGLATVEAAIALPVLLLVLFGIMGGGLLVVTRHQLDRASREGARGAAIASITNTQLKTIADKTLTFPDPATESVTQCRTTTSPVMITVTVSGKLRPGLAVPFFDIINPTISASTSIVPEWDPSSLPTCS